MIRVIDRASFHACSLVRHRLCLDHRPGATTGPEVRRSPCQAEPRRIKMSQLYQEVSKTTLDPSVKCLQVVVTGTVDDEDVELPPITIWL